MELSGSFFTRVASLAILWFLLAGAALITLWPSIPSSTAGWALLVVVGPPAYVSAEYLAVRLHSSRATTVLSQHPSRSVRIVSGVIVGLVYLAILLFASQLFGSK